MLVVGLTGAIASGKSTVSQIIHEKYNIVVVDADKIAKEVVLPGKSAYNKILKAFNDIPNLVVEDTKQLNREALGKAVFGNKEKLRILNGIVHPAVKWEIARQIAVAYFLFQKLVILDVPLLFEAGLHIICGTILTTSCLYDIQISRLLARNPELSEEDAQKRIASQASTRERNLRADIVIDNDNDLDSLKSSIDSIVTQIKPSWFWTVVNYIPGIVLLTAGYGILYRASADYFRRSKLKEE